ncbi:pyrroline-5-carboxylate reductase [Niallia taxi]|uniref:pyrroline-5-carboxylate reductase n=1 Tax=Niallia taxi TaxID=2499688 RepID=UPI00300B16E2
MKKLVFIGAGSMAEAIISGIIKSKWVNPSDIWVTNNSNKERLSSLQRQYGVTISYDLNILFNEAEAVVLAMKPNNAIQAIMKIRTYLSTEILVISILAGISSNSIEEISGKTLAIARAMPNTSAAIGKSATAIAVNHSVSTQQIKIIRKLFETIGITTFVAEKELDSVTGLSGSGPAYIYFLFEAMEKASYELGLDQEIAKRLVVQTFIGAAEMVKISQKSPKQLRKEVTSPGGTTEVGIHILEESRVQQALIECIKATAIQSKKIGSTFSLEINSKNLEF